MCFLTMEINKFDNLRTIYTQNNLHNSFASWKANNIGSGIQQFDSFLLQKEVWTG